MRFRSLVSLVCVCMVLGARGQQDWRLKKDQEGIRIYSRRAGGSPFDDIRVETILTGRLTALAAALLDIGNYPRWSFHCEKAYVLRRVTPSELYFYSLIRSPWPASDRDLAVHLRLHQDTVTHVLYVDADEVAGYIPAKKGIVRVPKSLERWKVTPLPGGQMSVSYFLQLDPGADAPSWLINAFSTSGPYETFSHLREQLREPIYRDATPPFIRN
ncbi:MAG TPA: START domain-containing protein [Puia sp.]|nr:START domain-containing protein [Puia sp.]